MTNCRLPARWRGSRRAVQRRTAFCLGEVRLLARAARKPKPAQDRCRQGTGGPWGEALLRIGLREVPRPEPGVHQQQAGVRPGFTVPADHPEKANILAQSVGTDPTLTLRTRRGTGLYKVPSLQGVWYRGPFEHNGSVATLEDWFDPRRLENGYVPTGWKGLPGTKTRAVLGHEFGLDLSADDRKALLSRFSRLFGAEDPPGGHS